MDDFTHFNPAGRVRMVDVSDKAETVRTALAAGRVRLNPDTLRLVKTGGLSKGDVLGIAQIAGILAAKHTSDLIPLCHPVPLTGADLNLTVNETDCAVDIQAAVRCTGPTGVEMEALAAVSAAALTVYDMCKAVQRDITIENIRLLRKEGGRSGVWERTE